ncbi:hypothetical protein HYY69_02005 [Candidatus Woesearchaeota archaeon]|nr:hypothetical protein [Candidatus Woesearchaeota archaeon]
MHTTRITKEISFSEYNLLKEKYNSKVSICPHAASHISNYDRNIYNQEELKKILVSEKPYFIGYQENENYAVFFKRKDYYLRIVFKIRNNELHIITFINSRKIPYIGRIKNDKETP